MPLSEVKPGMRCTALSVVRGTQIAQFDVEILDVIGAQAGLSGPRLLVRVSGPAVDATGIGPGFSGSPIAAPQAPPRREPRRRSPRASASTAATWRSPRRSRRCCATHRRRLPARRDPRSRSPRRSPYPASRAAPWVSSPAQPATPAVPCWRRRPARSAASRSRSSAPGASVAATLATGDLAIGAIGTVTYRDGARVWAFGHPLDELGRRGLFMEDAYVFGVISNPLSIPDLGVGTYKLTSVGGHVQGTVSSDASASIAGTIGDPPATIPLKVVARLRGGGTVSLDSLLADERSLGYGAGLSLVAPVGASQALEQLMRNLGPVTVSACLRVKLAGRARGTRLLQRLFRRLHPARRHPAGGVAVRRLRPAGPARGAGDRDAPRSARREVRRADLGAGAAPRRGGQACADSGEGAAPSRRA